jgi:hypothetical protein
MITYRCFGKLLDSFALWMNTDVDVDLGKFQGHCLVCPIFLSFGRQRKIRYVYIEDVRCRLPPTMDVLLYKSESMITMRLRVPIANSSHAVKPESSQPTD